MAVNVGIAPPNYASTTGQTRVLLGDTDAENITGGSGEYTWFGDDEIAAVVSLYGDSPKRAAARLLNTVAASQALLLKKWSADDLSVDGAAIAEALRKLAKDLNDDAAAGDNSIDIFQISYPGSAADDLWPEAFPLDYGLYGRIGFKPWTE